MLIGFYIKMSKVQWMLIVVSQCLTLLTGFTQADLKAIGCDEGWIDVNGYCYFIDNSRFVTWTEAVGECNSHDSSPMYFEGLEELNWYKSILQTFPSSAYWTNLNDMVNNQPNTPGSGHWKYGKYDTADMSLINWSASPGNDGKSLCGGINLQGNMYDADCHSKQGYICNIDNFSNAQGISCPFGWLPTDTDCYYVSNTTDPSQLITWSQAKARCVAMNSNAHLVTIDDANDQTFIQGHLPYLTSNTYLHWTGLQGNGQAGGWKWFNGATFSQNLFSWATEPDNVAGKENCAVIRYNGKFSDRGCNMRQNYICKKAQIYTDTSFNLGCGLWTRANTKCYVFYQGPTQSWQQAKQTCQSMRGDLLNVPDIDTNSWIREQMIDPVNGNTFYWTALNDIETEGSYKWGDGSSLNNNIFTWNNEPNDWKGNEDCAFIMASGQYNDVPCTTKAVPLCELDSVQTCPTTGANRGTWASRPSDTGTGVNCYFFGDYHNTSMLMSAAEARDYCTSLAIQVTLQSGLTRTLIPKLYAVDTKAERDFIKQQILNYLDNSKGFWTALTDAQTEGFWTFGNNIQADTSLVDWHQEPSSLSPDMDCVGVGYGALYMTQKCNVKMGYICERPAYLPWTSAAVKSRGSELTSLGLLFFYTVLRMFN